LGAGMLALHDGGLVWAAYHFDWMY
jgi:hypothetical protein